MDTLKKTYYHHGEKSTHVATLRVSVYPFLLMSKERPAHFEKVIENALPPDTKLIGIHAGLSPNLLLILESDTFEETEADDEWPLLPDPVFHSFDWVDLTEMKDGSTLTKEAGVYYASDGVDPPVSSPDPYEALRQMLRHA